MLLVGVDEHMNHVNGLARHEYLLAQWFAVGLLDLRRVTWESPGSILEKVIMLFVSVFETI